MNEPNPTRSQGSLSPILSEQAEALRRQAEIDLEVTMREHRYELDQILLRQKAILRALLFTVIAFLAAAFVLFAWLRHGDTAELERRKTEADKEVLELRKRNEEAQALVESFRELERAWKRRLIEAAGSRPADEPAAEYPAASNSAAESPPVYGPMPEPVSRPDGSKAVKP